MTAPVHATTIAIDGRAVLLMGPSGSGKSDLALRLIDRGATLVSDDYTALDAVDGGLIASAPTTIAGKIEVRGIGIVAMTHLADVPVALVVQLGGTVERMPEAGHSITLGGVAVPLVALDAFHASTPIKVALALQRSREAQ